ncbi:MAG: hypothetical protein ACFB9N_09750 [Geitlerinemataceae cyanobacterium]
MLTLPVARTTIAAIGLTLAIGSAPRAVALPPPEETPEEVLRNELIFEARSPVDGEPLTAAEYARLQAELAEPEYEQPVDPAIQEAVFWLRVLRAVRILTPL